VTSSLFLGIVNAEQIGSYLQAFRDNLSVPLLKQSLEPGGGGGGAPGAP